MVGYSPSLGGIEVICGPMFSGKTEELIRRLSLAKVARQKVQIFKPMMDDRLDIEKLFSRHIPNMEVTSIKEPLCILDHINDSTRVIGICEVQFFDKSILGVTTKLAKRGVRVVCSGLDQNFLGEPYDSVGQLIALADEVDKAQGVCSICGSPASKTFCTSNGDEQIVVGDKNFLNSSQAYEMLGEDIQLFEARCNAHFYDSL